jgi:hypothetical protein
MDSKWRPFSARHDLDDRLATFHRCHDQIKRADDPPDQRIGVAIAETQPDNRRSCISRDAKGDEIAVLRDQRGSSDPRLVSNHPVRCRRETEFEHMLSLVAGLDQAIRKARRQLSIDQKTQRLFRGDHGMIVLLRGEGQRSVDVSSLQIGIVAQDGLAAHAGSQHAENVAHCDAEIANAGAPVHPLRMHGDPLQQFGIFGHDKQYSIAAPCRHARV